ncbi:MAG: type I-C CRISPR-associated protein Cas8c/Csd1 [Clostridia bacterium]|nr:type I-C CRISPR-associated protein Cas8c/Csd1 [Clostridia bacterium]
MGLLQKAVETYDAHAALAGKVQAGQQPLAPIGHTITNANIEITLDEQGHLLDAVQVGKDEGKFIIPVTEESAGRTSAFAPHPLCEQVGHLSGEKEYDLALYLDQLHEWKDSAFTHPMLQPILNYVKGQTLLKDLEAHGMANPDRKALIRWRVVGIGEESGACWTNLNLFRAFTSWYEHHRAESNALESLCMISGEFCIPATQNPKGIVPINGNAKLISANDTSNFTFRGRFTEDWQAATIGYEATQKAHCALRWLIADQGVSIMRGGRTFLCWNPQGKEVPHAALPFCTVPSTTTTPTDYRSMLWSALQGRQSQLPSGSGVIIAAFDAATTGRLALTYYNELQASDFLQRLYDWDATCCWWGWNPESKQYDAIQSPELSQIVDCAFGTQRKVTNGGKEQYKLVTDDRVLKQQIQRLIACRIDKALFPADIERALVNRASTPQAYDAQVYRRLLITACAVIRKYYVDHRKEELTMTLDPERKDRSYQFGRLLAVLEKVERDTYGANEDREPNAIRLQSVYCQRPRQTANIIESQLERAYFPRLKPGTRIYYKNLIGEIVEQIAAVPEHEQNKPLGDTYLIGYYLQRNELYKSRKQKEDANEEEENEQ